jgi:hypothetical protein
VYALGVLLAVLSACGGEPAATPKPPVEPAQTAPTVDPNKVYATVVAVDLSGEPLAGLHPIATAQRNAFDTPLVTGPATDANGTSTLVLPSGQTLFVRAWDPTGGYFSNNYFDVLPSAEGNIGEMQVVMVASASLSATLFAPGEVPAANTDVGIMLFHPTEGPWWPDKANTDASGSVHFPTLPAGTYTLRLKASPELNLELPGIELPPGGEAKLGRVMLH